MRVMPRLLLLLFGLSAACMMFVTRCGIGIEQQEAVSPGAPSIVTSDEKHLRALLRAKDAQYVQTTNELEQRIADLSIQLELMKQQQQKNASHNDVIKAGSKKLVDDDDIVSLISERIQRAEVLSGVSFNNEFEVVSFCRFTLNRIYPVDPGLGKRVVEKPIGHRKRELQEVITGGLQRLNAPRTRSQRLYTTDDFIEGVYRTEPAIGTHYELYFRDLDFPSPTGYRRLVFTRPYAPLSLIATAPRATSHDVINLILPLKGRIETFRHFMERFIKICIKIDKRVHLTVVYFGVDFLNEVRAIIGKVSKAHRFRKMTLITLQNEPFSRGRGLQVGARAWKGSDDVLLFLCDVDIVFSIDFLERCRLNAAQGSRVYYPIVFSLYNPRIVYELQEKAMPPASEQLVISKDTGFWRDFGYGMTCQYRSDLMSTKGFDQTIHGWGMEDVLLYRKYVKSNMMVVRATDPGIFHLYHGKSCDPALPSDQYRGCIRSKALNEASHSQLGMLAFKQEIDIHRQHKKRGKSLR